MVSSSILASDSAEGHRADDDVGVVVTCLLLADRVGFIDGYQMRCGIYGLLWQDFHCIVRRLSTSLPIGGRAVTSCHCLALCGGCRPRKDKILG